MPSNPQKTRCPVSNKEPFGGRKRDAVHTITDFETARALLRNDSLQQAGFGAELFENMPAYMKRPILFLNGSEHKAYRTATAKFFTPATTKRNYQELMERFADEALAEIKRKKRVDLSEQTLRFATNVAAQIVGLTHSRNGRLHQRLARFFQAPLLEASWHPKALYSYVRGQFLTLWFFWMDLKPAIDARIRSPQEDIISHLLEKGYTNVELLGEVLVYAAAGMATTREFISVAFWHMMEDEALRERYLNGEREERHLLLEEILRLEPVVGTIRRRTQAPLTFTGPDGVEQSLPADSLFHLELYDTNADETAVGKFPVLIDPDRQMGEKVYRSGLSFGDGPHRCPGAYIALQESDIFLKKLLAQPDLKIFKQPTLTWSHATSGYELRNFEIGFEN